SIGAVNPPGGESDGLRVAVHLLLGREVDPEQLSGPYGNTLYAPIPHVVLSEPFTYGEGDDAVELPANFDEIFAEVADLPESYTLDGEQPPEEMEAYFLPVDGE